MAPSLLPRLLLLPSANVIRVWTRSLTAAARPRFSTRRPTVQRRSIVMANVTKANFGETCEQLQTQLRAAEFVALDFEMTGVEAAPWRRHSELDTCETRYQHIKNSAESFAVWQCGVCPFKWDEPGQKFIAYPYNFYIFPRNELPVDMTSRDFFCQTTSLEFLAKHHFDFNATVYTGISYLSMEQEEVARAKLGLTKESKIVKRRILESESEIPLTRTADVLFSERVRVQLGQWRDGLLRYEQQGHGTGSGLEGSNKSSMSPISLESPATQASGKDAESDISGRLNSAKGEVTGDDVSTSLRPSYFVDVIGNNQARLVKQVLRKHYQDLVAVMVPKPDYEDLKQVRIIFTISKEDRAKLEEELEEENRSGLEAVLSNAVGFRKIIDAIKAAGKPLVGHNCLLDLAHLHDKFLGPLPSSLTAFSASICTHFPCILDTKYLLKTEPTLRDVNVSRNTSLAIAYQELRQGFSDKGGIPGRFYIGRPKISGKPMSRVKVELASELQRYSGVADTGLKHEAGFDAYMTGTVFAQLCHILQVDVATIRSLPQAVGESVGLASYANLLMLQTFKAQVALDLRTGKEAVGIKAPRAPPSSPYRLPLRENVALLWGLLPARGQDVYLRKLVQTVLSNQNRLANVDVYSVDDSSAFVEFRSSSNLEAFFTAIQSTLAGIALTSDLETASPSPIIKAARFDGYEQICRSPLATQSLAVAADLLGINLLRVPPTGDKYRRGSKTAAQSQMDQSLAQSSNEDQKLETSSLAAFEVGPWEEQGSTPLEQGVVGRTDVKDISTDADDGIKLNSEWEKLRNFRFQFSNNEEMVVQTDSSAIESSNDGEWMKRCFHEDSQAVGPVFKPKFRKRPRAVKGTDDGGESNH